MKLLTKVLSSPLLITASMNFALADNGKYIIFGDSLTYTGSIESLKIVEENNKPATNGGEINGKNLVRNLENN